MERRNNIEDKIDKISEQVAAIAAVLPIMHERQEGIAKGTHKNTSACNALNTLVRHHIEVNDRDMQEHKNTTNVRFNKLDERVKVQEKAEVNRVKTYAIVGTISATVSSFITVLVTAKTNLFKLINMIWG